MSTNATPLEFIIGHPADARLSVAVLSRENPSAIDYDDGNWLISEIRVRNGGFKAKVRATLRAEDFQSFLAQIRTLNERATGDASFSTMEEWLAMQIRGDGRGHFTVTGEVRSIDSFDSVLRFVLAFDQTELPGILRGLEQITNAFPVRG